MSFTFHRKVDEEEVSNVSADIPAIEGITPLANESADLNETTMNYENTAENVLPSSVDCIPSSIISASVVEESSLKTLSVGATSLLEDATIVPDSCSSLNKQSVNIQSTAGSRQQANTNNQLTNYSILPHIDISSLATHDIFEL